MIRILVTNDDGITTTGVAKLAEAMSSLGEVTVVAPDREMSAISHALTLSKPLHVKEIRKRWFAVNGTPTDCVHLGIKRLVKGGVDLVVSGFNNGANLAEDVHYSGTVAGAVEGTILGTMAIAFSQIKGPDADLDIAAAWAKELAKDVLTLGDGKTTLLNVNFPPERPKGIKLTRLGSRHYEDTISEKTDDNGMRLFWISGMAVRRDRQRDTDCQVTEDGYISVTPLQLDLSNYEELVKMTSWKIFRNHDNGSP